MRRNATVRDEHSLFMIYIASNLSVFDILGLRIYKNSNGYRRIARFQIRQHIIVGSYLGTFIKEVFYIKNKYASLSQHEKRALVIG